MKAIIIYDNLAFVAKAIIRIQHLGCRPELDVYWTTKGWPITNLEHATKAEKSLIDAADAHLILMPAQLAHAFPFHLREWLERWIALRQIQDAALAVLGDGTHSDFPKTVSPELTMLALEHNLNFIVDQDTASGGVAKVPVRFPLERELPMPLELRRVECAAVRDSFRSFGIND